MIGLSLDQFWEMTPYEFGLVVGGYVDKQRQQMEMLAWVAACIMNCWTKKKITARKLLGPRSTTVDPTMFSSVEELDAHLAELRADKLDD